MDNLQVIDEIVKKTFDKTCLAKLSPTSQELTAFLEKRFSRSLATSDLMWSAEHKAVALVIRDKHQVITGVKYRLTEPGKMRYLSEPGSVHEGHWLKGEDSSKLLILEGEIDAYTAQLAGFQGDIIACGTNRLPDSQIKLIKAYKHIFLCPDRDLGGVELENSCKELLGPSKTIITALIPEDSKDLNELLQRRGYDECSKFIQEAFRTELEKDTRSLSQCIPELLTWLSDERNTIGDTTGWKSVDHLLGGGLRASEMSVINAFAKTGKSSFINNLIHNLAKAGKRIALASFEMDPARSIYPTLVSIASEINVRSIIQEEREELIRNAPEDFKYLNNIVTLRRFGYTPWSDIDEWAQLMKKLYQIDYLVLDHAGFMVEKMTDAEENQILAKNIKKMTNELGIHILVVVQAPKTKDGLSIQTSYGGLAWGMNADNFIILERSKDNETELRVKLEAARYPGANPSSTPALLFYQRDSCALIE